MVTDAQKRANNKYQLKHYTVLGCKLKTEDAEAFKAACEAAGTTPNAVFRDAITQFMEARQQPRGTE